jgi:hypothetical protein
MGGERFFVAILALTAEAEMFAGNEPYIAVPTLDEVLDRKLRRGLFLDVDCGKTEFLLFERTEGDGKLPLLNISINQRIIELVNEDDTIERLAFQSAKECLLARLGPAQKEKLRLVPCCSRKNSIDAKSCR